MQTSVLWVQSLRGAAGIYELEHFHSADRTLYVFLDRHWIVGIALRVLRFWDFWLFSVFDVFVVQLRHLKSPVYFMYYVVLDLLAWVLGLDFFALALVYDDLAFEWNWSFPTVDLEPLLQGEENFKPSWDHIVNSWCQEKI